MDANECSTSRPLDGTWAEMVRGLADPRLKRTALHLGDVSAAGVRRADQQTPDGHRDRAMGDRECIAVGKEPELTGQRTFWPIAINRVGPVEPM